MQRLWGLRSPQRTNNKQLSIGTPGSNVLDTGLLHQLRIVCALRPSALLRLTTDGSLTELPIQVISYCCHSIPRDCCSTCPASWLSAHSRMTLLALVCCAMIVCSCEQSPLPLQMLLGLPDCNSLQPCAYWIQESHDSRDDQ